MRAMNFSAPTRFYGGLLDAFHRMSLTSAGSKSEVCFLTYTVGPSKPSSCHPRALAERGPIVHELPALFEKIAAPIGSFDRIADSVSEGLVYDVVRMGGRLGGPVSERAAEPMDRHIASLHLLQHIRHGHVAQAGSSSGPQEHM